MGNSFPHLLLLLLLNPSLCKPSMATGLTTSSRFSTSLHIELLGKNLRVMRLRGAGSEAVKEAKISATASLEEMEEENDQKHSAIVSPSGTTCITPRQQSLPQEGFLARSSVQHVLGLGKAAVGHAVVVCGWARTIRVQGAGAFAFLELNDGSTFQNVQVVVDKGIDGWDDIEANAHTHTSWRAEGVLVESLGRGQETELKASSIRLLGMLCIAEDGK